MNAAKAATIIITITIAPAIRRVLLDDVVDVEDTEVGLDVTIGDDVVTEEVLVADDELDVEVELELEVAGGVVAVEELTNDTLSSDCIFSDPQ